jgi:hypothetical protein
MKLLVAVLAAMLGLGAEDTCAQSGAQGYSISLLTARTQHHCRTDFDE